MEQKVVLHKLQHMLKSLQSETAFLEKDIAFLLSYIKDDSFLDRELSFNIVKRLNAVCQLQDDFQKECDGIIASRDLPDKISEIVTMLQEKETLLSETEKYVTAWKLVMRMDSDDEQCKNEISDVQKKYGDLIVEQLSFEECVSKLSKLLYLIEVFNAHKPLPPVDIVKHIQTLSPDFGATLVTGVTLGAPAVFLRDEVDKVVPDEVEEEPIPLVTDNLKTKAPIIDATRDEQLKNESDSPKVLGSVDVSQIIENQHPFITIQNFCNPKNFGVKHFKNFIKNLFPTEKKIIMHHIFKCKAITLDYIKREIPRANDKQIECICNDLIKNGYVKAYHFKDMDVLYTLSGNGVRVFTTQGSASYMGMEKALKEEKIQEFPSLTSLEAMNLLFSIKACSYINEKYEKLDVAFKIAFDENVMAMFVDVKDKANLIFYSILDGSVSEDVMQSIQKYVDQHQDHQAFAMGYHREHVISMVDSLKDNIKGIVHADIAYNFSAGQWQPLEINEVVDHTGQSIKDEIPVGAGTPQVEEVKAEEDAAEAASELEISEIQAQKVTTEAISAPDVAVFPDGKVASEAAVAPDVAEIPDEKVASEAAVAPDVAEIPDEKVALEVASESDVAEIPDEKVASEVASESDVAEIPDETVAVEAATAPGIASENEKESLKVAVDQDVAEAKTGECATAVTAGDVSQKVTVDQNPVKESPHTELNSVSAKEYTYGQLAMAEVPANVDISPSKVEAMVLEMLANKKWYCATAYLYCASRFDSKQLPAYKKLAYAINDPLNKCRYDSNTLMNVYFDEVDLFHDSLLVAAMLRNFFTNHTAFDYNMNQLLSMAKENLVLADNPSLNNAIYILMQFKEKMHSGVDKYADYRAKDRKLYELQLNQIRHQAKEYYDNYIKGHFTENGSNRRFIVTQQLVFDQNGDLAGYLQSVIDNDLNMLDIVKESLHTYFMKDGTDVDIINLDDEKLERFIDEGWKKAAAKINLAKKTESLKGAYRSSLHNKLEKIIKIICDWVVMQENNTVKTTDEAFIQYKKIRQNLLAELSRARACIAERSVENEIADIAGNNILIYTIDDLIARLDGSYNEFGYKYFYVRFLLNSWVLLDQDYMPDVLHVVNGLDSFFPLKRIEQHYLDDEYTVEQQFDNISSQYDDYGTATLLLDYLQNMHPEEYPKYDLQVSKLDFDVAEKRAQKIRADFIEGLELAQSYGQIDTAIEDQKEKILQSINEWFERCNTLKDFGFFKKIKEAFECKIKEESKSRAVVLTREIEHLCTLRKDLLSNDLLKARVEKVHMMIREQNYTVAEDLISHLDDEEQSGLENLQHDYLREFLLEHDTNYRKVNDSSKPLQNLVSLRIRNKDTKGGQKLIDNWLSNGRPPMDKNKIGDLLRCLGFPVGQVMQHQKIANRIENYDVLLSKPRNGRRGNYTHSIAAFGSAATENAFRVVCLYGRFNADSLIETFKAIGIARHTLVLLDYALTEDQRHRLARKTKSDVPECIFGVIDRVILMYLVNHYRETEINRMVMSIIMPYTYYQPYISGAVNTMPPEMFIGRKEALDKIESATGENIVYGGRQLGKSALLRMAKSNIDFDENGDRAVLVDIKGKDYKQAAIKISQAMTDEGIFDESVETDDWDMLARKIKQRLYNAENKIPYLLLLIDEADTFIESSSSVNYQPFDALKDIQNVGQGRFKFVVAGLRNVVRFGREALNNNSVLAHLKSYTVKPFNAMEARELLEVPLSYLGLRFPKEKEALVSTILATTNYFPGLIQLYCYKLLEAMKKDYAGYDQYNTPPYDVQEKHIKKVLAEKDFLDDIYNKFDITLRVDEDCYYHIIAILMAYLYHQESNRNGYAPEDIVRMGKEFNIARITRLSIENVYALMEELRELNVLRLTANKKYLFSRYNFFQMMGNVEQLEDEIEQYMED